MKNKICLTFAVLLALLNSCRSVKQVVGTYNTSPSGWMGTELNLFKDSTFTYYYAMKMGLAAYAKGTYLIKNNKIILLSDYNKIENLKRIDSKLTITTATDNQSKIIPIMPSKQDYIVYKIKLDDAPWIAFDKPIVLNNTVKTIQLNAYQDFKGDLVGTATKIDTLRSDIINIGAIAGNKDISILLDARTEDFFRVNLSATLKVKGAGKLLWGKSVLRLLSK